MSGFFLMHRGWQENPIFEREEFSRRDAWIWLVENAAWKPSRARIKGETVELDRGQLCFAQRFMAEKWGWSKSRVDRFLKLLASEGMIETCTKNGATADHAAGQGQSIITICNYDKYQVPEAVDRGNDEPQIGATAGQQRTKEEQGKEYNTSEAKASSVSRAPKAAARGSKIPDDWQPELTDRSQSIVDGWPPGRFERELRRFRDHAADKGRISKDWQAAFRTWIEKADDFGPPRQQNSTTPGIGRTAAAANAVLERIREQRERMGQPACR